MVVFYSQDAAQEELILIHKRWKLHDDKKHRRTHSRGGEGEGTTNHKVTFAVQEVTAVHASPHAATTLEKEACFYDVRSIT